ncbi:MAG TPA: CHASE domain-containing protein [Pseudorhizobium sp.]|nr:CHASE domain-containing protein [Pseudorhizobium sp.]
MVLLSLAVAAAFERTRAQQELRDLETVADRIEGRIGSQTSLLSYLRSFLIANGYRVDIADIRHFLELGGEQDPTGGMQGIGIALFAAAGDLSPALDILRSSYRGNQRIWPDTDQPYRFPIVLLEPPDTRNQAAIGYDMFAEPVRRAAMERAWRSGKATATAPVELVQEITEEKQTGFLIYLPVMRPDGRSIHSMVYAPYRVGDLMRTALSTPSELGVEARVFDAKTDTVMLETGHAVNWRGSFPITVADREWRVDLAYRDQGFLLLRPSFVTLLVGGVVAVLLQRLLQQREQRIAAEREAAREAREAAEMRGLLLDETKHRLKNSIARISGIARLTARETKNKEEFLAALERQLKAFAAAQDLLNPQAGGIVDLKALLEAELASVGGSREAITIEGPPLALDANETQALGLVLHELLTNALKYGALGEAGGSLHVRWETAPAAKLEWLEVSPRVIDLTVSGFGTKLIDTLVKRQLRGTISKTIEEGHFRLVIEWPLASAPA